MNMASDCRCDDVSGIVTDIQRFSLKDGDGIRTTVFLKGCNMHCDWCHNPETLSASPELMLYPDKCFGCGKCVEVCPTGAASLKFQSKPIGTADGSAQNGCQEYRCIGSRHTCPCKLVPCIPATDVPATGIPATDVPATGIPATDVPATDVPATGIPATGIPATGIPATGISACVHPSRCHRCADVCFSGAIVRSGRKMTVAEVMHEILQDKIYYDRSGGGVTLSGGEMSCQPEFSKAILSECRRNGILTACETNMAVGFDILASIFACCDFVMCDCKLIDCNLHEKYTGIGNQQILDNIRRLDQLAIPYLLRTPLIPSVTDTNDNIAGIAAFASTLQNVRCWELLNFNPLGDVKYTALAKENPYAAVLPLTRERIRELEAIAGQSGKEVYSV